MGGASRRPPRPAEVVRAAAARAWELERDLTVSEWADQNYVLSSVSAAEPGRWRTERTPYLREIMNLMSAHDPCEELCLMKGAQIGFTELLLIGVGYGIEHDPAPELIVQPTLDLLKKFSKQRLAPAIEAAPGLRERVSESRERDSGNTMFVKEYEGGILMMTTARSASGLSSMPIKRLKCDEVDRYEGDVGGEGDPIELAKKRTATFSGRKCVYGSSPKLRGVSRIERLYQASDQRRYFIPCPQCGHMDFLTWSGFRDFIALQDGGHHRIKWDEGAPEKAYMVCADPREDGAGGCGARIEEGWKTWMLEHGEWRALSPGPGKMPGFHLSALYSPLGWYSWGMAAKEFLQVKTKPEEFQTWVNTVLGETWEEKGESVGWEALMNRTEQYPESAEGEQLVPHGVGILVAGVDVQADRLEWTVYGFGAGEESWLISFGAEPGDPAAGDVWRELDKRLLEPFTHASGQRMLIDCVGVDSQYQTEEVFKFCQTRLGMGRRVYPVRGGTETGQPFVPASPTRGNAYKVPLYTLCTDTGKGALYSRLLLRDPGPGYVHFPNWTKGAPEFFQQLVAEKRIRKWLNGRSTGHWIKIRDRNEELDKAVYALAALYIRGGGRAPMWLGTEAAKYSKPPEGPHPPAPPEPGQVQIPAEMLRPRRGNWVTGGGRWKTR